MWYTGFAGMAALIIAALMGTKVTGLLPHLLAAGVGATWATNALGGHFVVPATGALAGLAVWLWRRRDHAPSVLWTACLTSMATLGLGATTALIQG